VAHHHPGVEPQVARAQAGVGHLAHADGDVDALLDQIDVPVIETDVDPHGGVELHEAHHQGHQHPAPEGHRAADAQAALHLRLHQRGHRLGFFDMVRDELALLVVQLADLGGRDAVRGAVQQPGAELRLQLGHQLGGRRLADAQVGSSLAERAQVHHADEEPDALDAVHARHWDTGRPGRRIPERNNRNAP
jgi:hypothetical protein